MKKMDFEQRWPAIVRGALVVIVIAMCIGLYTLNARAANSPEVIVPQSGMASETFTVQVKNPEGVGRGNFTRLSFNDYCAIGAESEFSAVARYNGNVLVRLGNNTLSSTAFGPPCPRSTLFWLGEQQLLMSAEFRRQIQARQSRVRSEQELIRGLIAQSKNADH